VPNLARALESSVVDSYHAAIEEHVSESHYTDALETLIDFVRDCSPGDRIEAIGLYARFTRWKSAERRGVSHADNINEIVQAILEMTDVVAGRARIAVEVAIKSADIDPSRLEDDIVKASGAIVEERAASAESAPSTGQILILPCSEPHGHASVGEKPNGHSEQQEARLVDADIRRVGSLSEERVKSELSHQRLDQVLQTYLDVWRNTRKGGSETLVVQALDLVKKFPKTRFSLGPISFDLIPGEITGVIGMNASGKTTLLRLLLGEIASSSGTLSYPKLSTGQGGWQSIRNQIAYVSQMPDKWNGRLRLNLNYTAAVYGSLAKDNDELVDWYVHRYGLKEYENATWDRISGGYKIRFELVRALLTKPKLLVLDEPLAYLDIVTQQIFLSDIRSISSALANPIPVIVTSQHLYEIEAIANKMIILDDGHCLYSGPILQMPHLKEFRTYEITVNCKKKELLEALSSFGLIDLEVTMTSYILTFPKEADHAKLAVAMMTHFGDRLTYLRDITYSTRSLFRNKRDDIVYEEAER
jgi:ABC-2 type transport system ATP-binding protein